MKLPEVEQARALMTEAIDWSVMKWLSEKKRVRRAADVANALLDSTEEKLQKSWPTDLLNSYKSGTGAPDSLARKMKASHDLSLKLRAEAEDIFDRAEKRLSTALARDGCRKAIEGWDTHLKTIDLFEQATRDSRH